MENGREGEKEKEHLCYMLYSPSSKKTYVGYTVDLARRVRMHNGEIQGGANQTRRGRPWVPVFYITGFPNVNEAMRFEWRCHHPHKFLSSKNGKGLLLKGEKPVKKYGLEGRIESMCSIFFTMERVCSQAQTLSALSLKLHWVFPLTQPSLSEKGKEWIRKTEDKLKLNSYFPDEKMMEECLICYEPFTNKDMFSVVKMNCNHYIHIYCGREYIEEKRKCPICLHDIDEVPERLLKNSPLCSLPSIAEFV